MNAKTPNESIDNTIDRALSTLRDAQPRSGLEGRILATIEHRSATVPGGPSFHNVKGWGIARGSARGFALLTATAAAILAIASMAILHQRTTIPAANGTLATAHPATNSVILSGAHSAQSKNPETASRATNAKSFSTTNLAQTTHTLSSRPERVARSGETPVFRNCSDHHDTGCPIHDDNVGMGGLATTPTDAQALADLHAPSHPAPPLPLTRDEKLLLRMLRYGNLTQLAELNPEVRAKQDADETTAFKAFFPDPPPVQQTGDNE